MSNKENQKGNPSEGKKFIKYLFVCTGLYVAGYLFGMMTAFAKDILTNENLIAAVESALTKGVPVLFVLLNAVVFTGSMIVYWKAKKMADNWDGEEEEDIDAIEKKLNNIIVAYNIVVILNLFFFGVMVEIAGIAEIAKGTEWNIPYSVFAGAGLLISLGLYMFAAKLVVDLEKRLNPERRQVSIFDMNFEKRWEESSDEAQKQIMYKAGYAAYKAANIVCSVMWGVTLMGQLVYATGVFPMACICIIWGVSIGTFSIVCAKLEGGSTFKRM